MTECCCAAEYLKANQPARESVYGGQFRVAGGRAAHDPGSIFHLQQTEEYRTALHSLLASSPLAPLYRGTEVFLLER